MRTRFATMALIVLVGLAGWLLYPRLEARAQTDNPIRLIPGVPVQGSLTTRFGEEWVLAGCAGDVMTATIQSTAFAPNLELYPPVGRTPVATTRNTNQRQAQLARTALPENGEYTLVALGATVRDRGRPVLQPVTFFTWQSCSREPQTLDCARCPVSGRTA